MLPLLLLTLGSVYSPVALVDRAQLPQDAYPYTYYLSLEAVPDTQLLHYQRTLPFILASSSSQSILERCTPTPIGEPGSPVHGRLYRINIQDLHWSYTAWTSVLRSYPYALPTTSGANPLVIRADWLITQLSDANASPAYDTLLYGKPLKTRNEILSFWKVPISKGPTSTLNFGLIEGDSGVSAQRGNQKTRWIESFPLARGYAWGTRDAFLVNFASDPLEHPDGSFKHDGEEWIIGIPKLSLTTGEWGTLQVYFLADGDGKVIAKADGDLVTDHTSFRGYSQIRYPGSCIQCHVSGLLPPSTNEFRRLVQEGVDPYTKDRTLAESLERFHGSQPGKFLTRANEDFAITNFLLTGHRPEQNVRSFSASINWYDSHLSLDQASRELDCTPEVLIRSIAHGNNNGLTFGARLSRLAHGTPIPRTVWEEAYPELLALKKGISP